LHDFISAFAKANLTAFPEYFLEAAIRTRILEIEEAVVCDNRSYRPHVHAAGFKAFWEFYYGVASHF